MPRPNKHRARFGRWTWLAMTTRTKRMPTLEQAENLRAISRDTGIGVWSVWGLLGEEPGFCWAMPYEWPHAGTWRH